MAFHSYSLFVEGHTYSRGYQFIPIVGPMVEVPGSQRAPVGRVLAWLKEQREPLQAALAEMHARGATGITLTVACRSLTSAAAARSKGFPRKAIR